MVWQWRLISYSKCAWATRSQRADGARGQVVKGQTTKGLEVVSYGWNSRPPARKTWSYQKLGEVSGRIFKDESSLKASETAWPCQHPDLALLTPRADTRTICPFNPPSVCAVQWSPSLTDTACWAAWICMGWESTFAWGPRKNYCQSQRAAWPDLHVK